MQYNEKVDYDKNINIDEIIKMLAIHEIGETLIGDITPFDGITPEEKRKIEFKAVEDLLGNLKEKTELLDLFSTFESHISNESIFSYFCDKIEADLQSKFYQDTYQHRNLNEQENNKVMNLEITKRLIEEGAKTPFDIWYAYDKKIYTQNPEFREFTDILTFIKNNNMIREHLEPVLEKVELSNEEYSFLTNEISKFLDYALHNPDVEAVTQINISSGEFEKGMIVIDLIVVENSFYASHQVMIERLTEQFRHINFTEIPVLFRFQCIADYIDYPRLGYSKIMKDRLSSSKILLDKTGRITKLKDERKDKQLYNPVYTIEYIPPVEEEITKKLKK
jgi:5'-deoxynucleotidase YfbR-like HD superfamily hydrolase